MTQQQQLCIKTNVYALNLPIALKILTETLTSGNYFHLYNFKENGMRMTLQGA